MINRMVEPTSGDVLIDGTPVSQLDPVRLRRSIGYVMQNSGLMPHFTVADNIATVPRLEGATRRAARSRALELMDTVGLAPELADRYPSQLSGGQQQRVGIARALVLNPKLVICDEAVSALDLSTQGQIINLLTELQESTGVSYLFIAHDLGLVRHIADRVGVMNQGRLVELGETERVYEQPADPYTQRLLRATPASTPVGRDERRAERKRIRAERAVA